ncbi:MAG: hypothetical protein JWP82_2836 [Humibacillus sp.]|nr:hypothetical protein [Humibacillus sp.]
MRVHVGVQGRATAPVAWERYADPDAWSGWSPQIRSVETAAAPEVESGLTPVAEPSAPSPRRIVAGLRGVVLGPVGVQVPFEVLGVDEEAMTWTWRVHAVLAELTLEHSVSARVGGGCRTDLFVDGPAPLVLGYAPLARLALTRLVRP